MAQKSKTVQFQKEKDTKNTVKFAETQSQGEAPIIGALYVQPRTGEVIDGGVGQPGCA